MKSLFLALLCLFSLFFTTSNGAKILYMMAMASTSHRIAFNPLILELAKRGHEITVVSPNEYTKNVKNVKEIVIETNHLQSNPAVMQQFYDNVGTHPLIAMIGFKYFVAPTCENYLKHPSTKEMIKKGKQFDVAIVSALMNDCGLAIASLLAKHTMTHSSGALMPWTYAFVPQPPSYVPSMILPYTSKMSFFQRLHNLVVHVGVHLIMDYHVLPVCEKLLTTYVPEAPSVYDVRKHVSFILLNVDPILTSPRPTMPNIANVGGLHCGKAKPIPKEFEDFIKTSGDNGFIVFSLGSNFPSSALSKEKIESILSVFAKLKQKVIWKFETKLEDKPPNVMISSWIPQQDLLAQPQIRLLITHGGLLSLQEAVYHGVPTIVIPIFGDQLGNAARVEELEIGYKIDFNNVTADSIQDGITTILSNKQYAENMKKYSSIFRDQYQDPVHRAAFWVEYVIRHNGAPHFRSPGEDLNFFQYFLLDIIALFSAIIFSALFALYAGTKFILRKVCPCKNKSQKASTKKKTQ